MDLLKHKDKPQIKAKIANYLKNPDTYGLVLISILLDNYDTDWLSWEIDTIEMELQDDFYVDIPSINSDKIQALMTAMTSDMPYRDWIALNMTCEALNDNIVDAEVLEPVTPEELAWGLTQLAMLEDNDTRPEFDEEVRRYMGAVLAEHGIINPPDILKLAIMPKSEGGVIDPFMERAKFDKRQEDEQYIMDYVKENLAKLIEQLNNVPLSNRDTESWGKLLKRVS